jgi:hypothetical protein
MGRPVYLYPERGGGWSLVGGARTDLTGLTSPEARALFLLAGPAAAVAPPVRSALRKLVRALPSPTPSGPGSPAWDRTRRPLRGPLQHGAETSARNYRCGR